jgi:hypothetical protein
LFLWIKPLFRAAFGFLFQGNPNVMLWIASQSLSSGARSRDPLARDDT